MNAAYLMLTTAWLAGADPAPVTPAAPTGPVVAAPIGGGCGGGCGGSATDACCEHESKWAKLKAKFKKHNDCGCEQSCAPAPKPVCCPAPAPTCCHAAPVSCGCEEPRVKLCDRIKAKFKKHNDCGCESSCNSCGGASGVPTGAPAEAIPTKPSTGGAPMPVAPKGSVMNGGMIVTPVVAPRLTNEQPF